MPNIYDVLIVGGGGAGLTAALYASRAKLSTIVLERLASGGQIALTDLVENYPGFPAGMMGPDISIKMEEQARKYGAEVVYHEARQIRQVGRQFEVQTASKNYLSRSVILAAGASFRRLGVKGEKELTGKGVSYCATCDGAFFKDKNIVVVGGGDSAMQEGLFLTRFASSISVVHRRDQLRAGIILQERARKTPQIKFIWDTVPEEIRGDQKVQSILLKNVRTGEKTDFETDGVFIFIGHEPNSGFLKGFVELDDQGYVKTDLRYQTSIVGVFAAGEVRKGATRQLIAVCGEGCSAALAAQAYLEQS